MSQESFPSGGTTTQECRQCADCPVLGLYTDYVIQKNLDPGVKLPSHSDTGLSRNNYKLLRAMIEPPAVEDMFSATQRVLPEQSSCSGPVKQFRLFGKRVCNASYAFISEDRV